MPYDARVQTGACTVCTSPANILQIRFRVGEVVNCSRCGDFRVSHVVADDLGLPLKDPKKQALASYTIRRMQSLSATRPQLTREFFRALETRSLPTPAEASDNLIRWLAEKADGSPGAPIQIIYADHALIGAIGVIGGFDSRWVVESLVSQGLVKQSSEAADRCTANLTAHGWKRFEELRQAHVSSRFAFFARKFDNPDLDTVYRDCLRPAVAATGYELRMATQRAGLIDAVIEDEIRRCRFVIADLSDKNDGAYWEAGLAEGLGKPVIYICRARDDQGVEITTHFDANHRQTIRWDLGSLEQTSTQLKAVIRNTLLGEANQSD
jgi:hypothetical protein